ncbi:MAG: hypothetical protein JXA57_10540, partial [Armatimonadetes bacterium]|nr:hypothetical protein [Armatimonadota bacterium]
EAVSTCESDRLGQVFDVDRLYEEIGRATQVESRVLRHGLVDPHAATQNLAEFGGSTFCLPLGLYCQRCCD